MMIERMTAKLFIEDAAAVRAGAFVPVFHRWIREGRVEGLLIDVADYKHVADGPGILLMGHDGDYALDLAGGRLGLLYKHKRDWPADDLQSRLQTLLQRVQAAARQLEEEEQLGRLTFRPDEIELTFPDRLNAPNTPDTFSAVQDDVTIALREFYGDTEVTVEHIQADTRRPLTLRATLAPVRERSRV